VEEVTEVAVAEVAVDSVTLVRKIQMEEGTVTGFALMKDATTKTSPGEWSATDATSRSQMMAWEADSEGEDVAEVSEVETEDAVVLHGEIEEVDSGVVEVATEEADVAVVIVEVSVDVALTEEVEGD